MSLESFGSPDLESLHRDLDRARLRTEHNQIQLFAQRILEHPKALAPDRAVALAALGKHKDAHDIDPSQWDVTDLWWDKQVLHKVKWSNLWEITGKFASKFSFRFILLVLSRIQLGNLMVESNEFEDALQVYVEAMKLLAGNLSLVGVGGEEKEQMNLIFGKAKMNSPHGTPFDRLVESYKNLWGSIRIEKKFTHTLPASGGQSQKVQSEEFKGHDQKDNSLIVRAYIIGDLIVEVINSISFVKFRLGDLKGAFEIFRSVLGINLSSEMIKDQYIGFTKLLKSHSSNQIISTIRCALCYKFGKFLIFSISKSQYIPLDFKSKTFNPFKSAHEEASLLLQTSLYDSNKIYSPKSHLLSNLIRNISILMTEMQQYSMASDILRSAVSSDVENFSLWYKLALSLTASQDYSEAYIAVKHCLRIEPENFDALLLASKLCLNYLSDSSSAVHYSSQALEIAQKKPSESGLIKVAQYVHGVCCSRNAYEVSSFSKRKHLQEMAYENLQELYTSSKYNYKSIFHLAAIQADVREVNIANSTIKEALRLNPSDVNSWQLLALLGSSRKQFKNAVIACNAGIQECGESVNLLFTRTLIQIQEMKSSDSDTFNLAYAKSILSGFKLLLKKEFPKMKYDNYEVKDLKLPLFIKRDDEGAEDVRPKQEGSDVKPPSRNE
jgi:tetratricopeptide (TPR) repeat protein